MESQNSECKRGGRFWVHKVDPTPCILHGFNRTWFSRTDDVVKTVDDFNACFCGFMNPHKMDGFEYRSV